MPVVPATLEAVTGGLLESGRWKLQYAVSAPLHCRLGDRARPCLRRKKCVPSYIATKEVRENLTPGLSKSKTWASEATSLKTKN